MVRETSQEKETNRNSVGIGYRRRWRRQCKDIGFAENEKKKIISLENFHIIMRIYKRSRRVKREILVGVLSKFVAESVEVD